jgi:DNA-binding NarL/FixJ family response regulator
MLQDDSEAEFQLERLNSAAQRMQSMIKNILKLSRINTSAIKIVKCNLNMIIDDVKDQLSELVKQFNADIIVEAGSNDFFAEPSLMAQLLQNLIGNAIKFSTPDLLPQIVIRIEKFDTYIRISCQDNGIGIEEDYLQHIFEPFRRLHSISEYHWQWYWISNMPKLGGLEALSKLQYNPKLSQMVIVTYSTSSRDKDLKDAYKLGVKSYLLKPNSMTEIKHMVEAVSQYWFTINSYTEEAY